MRKLLYIAGFAVASLAVIALLLWKELVEERERADAMAARVVESPLRAESAVIPEQVPGASGDSMSLTDVTPAKRPDDDADQYPEERQFLQEPTLREARRRYRQLELASGHIELAKVLGISQETADQLLALLVDRELRYLSKPHPNPRTPEELRIRKLENEQAQYEEDREIAALIGEARLPRWKEYQASLPARHQVRQLQVTLFGTGEPLREEQVEPLISALTRERQRADQELSNYAESLKWSGGAESKSQPGRNKVLASLAAAADERTRAAAAAILSQVQLASYERMIRSQRELREAHFEEMRARDEAARLISGVE